MPLKFKSSSPETFMLLGRDEHGRERIVTATKYADQFNWQLKLTHPSGQSWPGTFAAPGGGNAGIIDAMGDMMRSRDSEFVQDRARGDRPREQPRDNTRSVDGAPAPISAFSWRTR